MKGFTFMNNSQQPSSGQISMPGMASQQPQPHLLRDYLPQTPQPEYPLQQQPQAQPLPPQQTPLPSFVAPQPPGQIQQPIPQPRHQREQEVKFYKSGIFRSAAGQFERDHYHMLGRGWRVIEIRPIGLN